MLCPNCDTRNDATAHFCRVCGTPLASTTTAPAAQPTYTVSNATMTSPVCPACARANPQGARYCVYCAAALDQPATYGGHVLQPAYAMPGTVTHPAMPQLYTLAQSGNLLIRAIWFVAIGWWLGLLWTIFAWLFNLTVIGLPVGVMMLHAIPQVMTLRSRNSVQVHVGPSGNVLIQRPMEHPFVLRAIWFVLIGWWASLLWMLVAWSFSASIILMPIAFWMFDRVPTILTLAAE